jgi:23S rRNA (adenine2503-C2)-methyltransferase
MGMGEPLDNFDHVARAIMMMSDQKGFNIAKRRITLPTIGLADGLRKLSDLRWPDLKLAISLNAPNDKIRTSIMPANKKFPMGKLRQRLMDYPLHKKSAFLIEYVLIRGLNDTLESARQLAAYLKPLKVKVNLIPVNPGLNSGFRFETPLPGDLDRFHRRLTEAGVFVRKRTTRGRGLMAACGQLGGSRQVDRDHLQRSGMMPSYNT